jgi:hypothetical protein
LFTELARSTPRASPAERGRRSAPAGAADNEIDHLARERLVAPFCRWTGRGATHASCVALTGAADLRGRPDEVRRLRARLDDWHDSGAPAALRLCFRLTYVEEGLEDDEPAGWLLEFLLQPLADPSVLIPAGQVWSELAAPLLSWIDLDPADRTGADPQEILLGGLGRASRLYPDLDVALHEQQPTEMALDVAGAYRFLTHAPLLTEAGFGVLLPALWQRRTDLGLTLTVHSPQATSAVLRTRPRTATPSSTTDGDGARRGFYRDRPPPRPGEGALVRLPRALGLPGLPTAHDSSPSGPGRSGHDGWGCRGWSAHPGLAPAHR